MSPVTPHVSRPIPQQQTVPGSGGRILGGHLVTIQSAHGQVTAFLGEEGATITTGYGGWEVTARPRDVGMITWQGRAPFEMDLPMLLDQLADGGSVEAACLLLERMAVPVSRASSPPTVRVTGAVPRAGLRWVVEGIDWGEALRNVQNGHRVRQAVGLHLIEFQPPELRAPRSKATPRNAKIVRITKATNTWRKLAKKHLENANRWKDIRRLNPNIVNSRNKPIRSPTAELPVGKNVLVPKK